MDLVTEIDQPTLEIATWRKRWTMNRDFIAGSDAVKCKGEEYLPKNRPDDSDAVYKAHKKRTKFYPAALKISQGLAGMIGRKKPVLNTKNVRLHYLASTYITRAGWTLDDLAAWVVDECMATNFVGLLPDHPDRSQFPTLNPNNADEIGYRPTINPYIAENILEVTAAPVGLLVKLVHVRLLENCGTTVRQLILNDNGFYEVRIWNKTNAGWTMDAPIVPLIDRGDKRGGQPLTEIPFVLVNTNKQLRPTPSLLQPSVDLNLQHYVTEGYRANMLHTTSGPIAIIKGYAPADDEDPMEFDVAPNAVWVLPNMEMEADWFEFDPKGGVLIENALSEIKDELSTTGHSMLAPEKPAPEAAETQMIRRAAENAALAAFANKVSADIQRALSYTALWADPTEPDVTYKLNTDYMAIRMDAPTLAAWLAAFEAQTISWETYFYGLRDGGLVDATLTPDQEEAQLAANRIKLAFQVAQTSSQTQKQTPQA